ncbi:protein SPT2 homolog [Megalops cyprinoides]|uniref:protein SPT2 homolog n=1 Tax=Megalops cyprinoides TaxID=118141 RepID=UPI0018644CB2|nr:protein SPT2 homolog [Megalops cyprinoides]
MDFENVLSIATQNQGLSSVPKRYSLQAGPPKKDPKMKGVKSSAIQAFLKKKEVERKQKELESRKQKEELLAKRVELKSDRKARAMASRTKDNFKGYNGIPVVEQPKRRQVKSEMAEEYHKSMPVGQHYTDKHECAQFESESRPVKKASEVPSKNSKKPSSLGKPAPPPMNFCELLQLAEKKQYEPVELKPVKKTEERYRTAAELKELEMERKVKRGTEAGLEKDRKTQAASSSSKKSMSDKEVRNEKPHKSSTEKPLPSGVNKKPKPHMSSEGERLAGSTKPSQSNRPKHASSGSSSSGAFSGKTAAKPSSQVPAKQFAPKPSSGQKPSTTSDLNQRKGNSSLPPKKSSGLGPRLPAAHGLAPERASSMVKTRPGSNTQVRPGPGPSGKPGPAAPPRPTKGEPVQPGKGLPTRPGSTGQMRPATGGPQRQMSNPQARPGGNSQVHPGGSGGIRPMSKGPQRPGGSIQGRPVNGTGLGPGRPKCTVVSETISSTSDFTPRPRMGPRPPPGHRPIMRPGPPLPPITSSYKRKYEDEEDDYDSEMEDFIDDEGEEQSEISKHIREIFGYDRTKYKEESDYALRFMESSWREQQKEEARSLKLAVLEDLEEEQREQEELKQCAKKKKR